MIGDKHLFSQFEAEENLFERRYNGVPYWQMLRFMVCEGAYSERIEQEDAVKKAGRKTRLRLLALKLPRAYINSCIQFKNLEKCDVLCLGNIERKNPVSKFFDYWRMPSDISVLRINERINTDMLDVRNQYNLIEPYCKGQVAFHLKKLFGKLRIDEQEHIFLQELEKKIREQFGNAVSAQRMELEILHWLEIDKAHELFFKKFFDKISCKAMVVVCYYQHQLYSAYRVAHKKGIRIIEFQHGVISNHEEYWFEDQREINNYTPDYFLAFGEKHISWTKMLPHTKALAIGFPYQEVQIEKLKEMPTEENTVIVYPVPFPEMESVIDEFASLAVKKGYRVILKIHPSEAVSTEVYYPLLAKNPNVELVTSQAEGIYYWLKLGKHHVMADTTVGLEATMMEHANICIATHVPHMQTQPLLDWGVARGFTTADELMLLIEHPISNTCTDVRNGLWKAKAEQNMQIFFQNLKAQNWPEGKDYKS